MIVGEDSPFIRANPGGPPGGLEGGFISEVARRLGVKVEFVRTARTHDELFAQVTNATIDVGIGQLNDSLKWAKVVRFSKTYVTLHEINLVTRLAAARSAVARPLYDDPTARVSTSAGSIVVPALQEEFGQRLVILPTLSAAIDEVLAGKTVAAVGDEIAVIRWLNANPAAGLRLELSARKERSLGLALAVNWKARDLQVWLNMCIDKCVLDGTLPALIAKHLAGNQLSATK